MIDNTAPENSSSVRHSQTIRRSRTIRRIVIAILSFSALTLAVTHAGAAAAAPPAARAAQLYNTAQRAFINGQVRAGLDALNEATVLAPANTNILALRAFWGSQAMDFPTMNDSLNRLGAINPAERDGVVGAINSINYAASTPPSPLPSLQGPQTAIVVLGYGLLPDGSMRPELVDRLWAGWREAVFAPFSPIIVTGGNPHNGIAEGQAMAAWLIGHGIPPGRIHPETRANSTVQNALFSARIIRSVGAGNAVVVSSANHVRRGTADLSIAGIPVVAELSPPDHLAAQLLPLLPYQERGMYIDATRVFGLPGTI